MKQIRVYYTDTAYEIENGIIKDQYMQFIHDRLSKYYNVLIDPKTPQIVFGNMYGTNILKYDAVRVSVSAEEYAPDFNVYDYALTAFQDFSFRDRVFCYNVPLFDAHTYDALCKLKDRKSFTIDDLEKKTDFCSFIQSKGVDADSFRTELFEKLSAYKRVDSGGRFMNNIGGPVVDKIEFEHRHKFSISCINGKNYTLQDRPLDAFAAGTLPIYWGNPAIGETYNTKAFINCMDYHSVDEVVKVVKQIDNDDARYIEMMNEPVFCKPITLEGELNRLDDFLIHIVENGSAQRSGVYWNKTFEKEFFYGRKRVMRQNDIAKRIRPVTKILFSSQLGQRVKRGILKQMHKLNHASVYRKIK